jgi:hypothetical protein
MMANIPPFDCLQRCQAPDEFFSGGPWVYHPKDKVLQLKDEEKGFIEWQIWEGVSGNASSTYVILLDGEVFFVVSEYHLLISFRHL